MIRLADGSEQQVCTPLREFPVSGILKATENPSLERHRLVLRRIVLLSLHNRCNRKEYHNERLPAWIHHVSS